MKNAKSRQWSILGSIGASSAIVLALSIILSRDGTAAPVSLVAPAFSACNIHCHSCDNGHWTHYDAYNSYDRLEHASCWVGTCSEHHTCGGISGGEGGDDALSVQDALGALQSGSLGTAQALASRYSKTVSINKKFNAVQILDCTGKVAALIPLSDPGLAVAAN
jgi:hypothetical protein